MNFMTEILPEDIKRDLKKAYAMHQRATSDYVQCEEFSKLMCYLLSRLEDACCFDTADKVMKILLDCNPKVGSHCEKATIISQVIKSLEISNIKRDLPSLPDDTHLSTVCSEP